MTIDQALSVSYEQIHNMSLKELRKYAHTLFSASNKRLKRARADAHARTAPAIRGRKRFSTKLGYRNKIIEKPKTAKEKRRTWNYRKKLINEISRSRHFLRMETSTLKGFRNVEKKTVMRFRKWGMDYKSLSKANKNLFWENYNKYKESHLAQVHNVGSLETQKAVYKAMFKLHISDTDSMNKYINASLKVFQRQTEKENEPMTYDEWKKKGDVDL